MIDELAAELPAFLGSQSHVRCFAYVVNLTVKGVLWPFEGKKTKETDEARVSGEAGEIEDLQSKIEELRAQVKELESNTVQDANDLEGFVDVMQDMSNEEKEEWERNVQPIHGALTKVRYQLTGFRNQSSGIPGFGINCIEWLPICENYHVW